MMEMMMNFIWVALGSALGGIARYGAGLLINSYWKDAFPLATFGINILGSFIIGVLASVLGNVQPESTQSTLRLLLVVGVCGGFTTFSSFSLETLSLLRSGQTAIALSYIALSVALCVGATVIGFSLFKN